MEKKDKLELERKERNKKLFLLGLAGIVVFEFLRNYLGTFLTVLMFAVAGVLISRIRLQTNLMSIKSYWE